MTIILAIGNRRQVIQFSDRRLSSAGHVIDDRSNKATAFVCTNGRFAVGYTGLASHKSFRLQQWLVDSLGNCAPPEFAIMETCERLCDKLTELFSSHPDIRDLSPKDKRLTVFLSGYLHRPDRPYIGNIWITNYQDLDSGQDLPEAKKQFWIADELENEGPEQPVNFVQRTGAWRAMQASDELVLRNLLDQEASELTLIDAGVGLIREMGLRTAAGNSIGREVAVIVVPRDHTRMITARVRIASGANSWIGIDQVTALPGDGNILSVQGLRLDVAKSPSQKAFQPKLGRNERCWCKSGRKFKHCHGRQST